MGVREYLLSYKHFCGIKYAALYGKDCHRLTEIDRTMCECALIDLEKADDYFKRRPLGQEGSVPVIFYDWELKIPALENASRYCCAKHMGIKLEPIKSDFPEFSEAIAAKYPSGSVYYTWKTEIAP